MSPRCALVGLAGLASVATLFVQVVLSSPMHAKMPRQFYNVSSGPVLPLKFRNDGSFQLSIFEDLHFGENSWDTWGPQQDINSVKVLNAILDVETPDLAVLNGDLITGNNAFLENSTVYVDQIVGPLLKRGLTWASTYGNHDSDFNLSRYDLLAREQQWPNARTQSMVAGENAGVSNYYLPVYGKDCDVSAADVAAVCTPVLILWFFDSRGGYYFQKLDADGAQVGQPDWVDTSVVAWFEATHAALTAQYAAQQGRSADSYVLPSLAFVHIPTNVSYAIQQEPDKGIDLQRQPGINDDNPLAQQAQGWCANGDNDCDYGAQDEPFMRAIANAGAGKSIIAMFSGHDHGDTWCYKWDRQIAGMDVVGTGLAVCFGQHSGYGGYGTWTRGARQVVITEDDVIRATGSRRCQAKRPDVKTWIRLETGDIVGAVTLNSTYGVDVYPETADTYTNCPTCVY